jgi:hypothetical protein
MPTRRTIVAAAAAQPLAVTPAAASSAEVELAALFDQAAAAWAHTNAGGIADDERARRCDACGCPRGQALSRRLRAQLEVWR